MGASQSRVDIDIKPGAADAVRTAGAHDVVMGNQGMPPSGTADGGPLLPHRIYENLTNVEFVNEQCKELLGLSSDGQRCFCQGPSQMPRLLDS